MKITAIMLLAAIAVLAGPAAGATATHQLALAPIAASSPRDGSHDFDWLHGSWRATFKLLRRPLAGSHDWYTLDGAMHIDPIFDDRGNFETGRFGKTDYATLRLYDARTHQWSIYWATPKAGLGTPPEVGSFDGHGNGSFYAWHDTFNGRPIASRYQWTVVDAGRHYHFEQAFSVDKGKTWEVNWISEVYRLPSAVR